MTEQELYRPCPHCGGKNTGYWIIGVEELEVFTTRRVTVTTDGTSVTVDACTDRNRCRCAVGVSGSISAT